MLQSCNHKTALSLSAAPPLWLPRLQKQTVMESKVLGGTTSSGMRLAGGEISAGDHKLLQGLVRPFACKPGVAVRSGKV